MIAAIKQLITGQWVTESGMPLPEWFAPGLDDAIPQAERDAALHQSVSKCEHERDKTIAELNKQIERLQKAADAEIAQLHSDAQQATEALAAKLARNEFSALVPIVERVIKSSGTDLPALRELSETYERLEARSRKLLPVIEGAGGSIMARTHRLSWAVAQAVCNGDPSSYPFVRAACDGFEPHYTIADAIAERQLIDALKIKSPTNIWRAMILMVEHLERLARSETPVPGHWRIRERLKLLRFGGLPDVIDRELRALKHREDEPIRKEAERLSAEHAAEFARTHRKRVDGSLTIIEPVEDSQPRAVSYPEQKRITRLSQQASDAIADAFDQDAFASHTRVDASGATWETKQLTRGVGA